MKYTKCEEFGPRSWLWLEI